VETEKTSLQELLYTYNERREARPETRTQILSQFERTVGLLVLDSSGFARTVRPPDIVHFLAMLERLQRTVRPVIRRHHGYIRRVEADTIMVVFEQVHDAMAAAADILMTVRLVNDALPVDDELYVSIGVGHGPTLLVGETEMFGNELARTLSLGEDLAQQGEVLVTPQAYAALGDTEWAFVERTYSVGGADILAYRLDAQ
jgi:adenylate cyclase